MGFMPVGTHHGASGGRQMCGGERVPPIPYRNVTNIKKHNLC